MTLQAKKKRKKYAEIDTILSGEKKYLKLLELVNTDKSWERFLGKINEQESVNKEPLSLRLISNNKIYSIAAAIMIFLLTAISIFLIKNQSNLGFQQVSTLEYITEVSLTDGSIIALNKGSELNYASFKNRKKREVQLKGEAFFTVTKNDAAPFLVQLNEATIKVLGTSFNIKEKTGGDVIVHVVSGKVSFCEKDNEDKAVILKAGERALFDNLTKEINISNFQSDNFLFWKTRNLSFNQQNLGQVFRVLESNYNVTFKVKEAEILNNKLTSECKGQQLTDILHELSILFNLSYSQEGNIVSIQRK